MGQNVSSNKPARQENDAIQTSRKIEFELGENDVQKEGRPDGIGRIYRVSGNLLIIKDCCKTVPKQFVGCVRDAIVGFSVGASTRMRRYLRECLAEYDTMVTLTYPGFFSTDGVEVKNHLRRFLQEVRREYMRRGKDVSMHSSFWFLEFQARGAPHFHIFTTWAPDKDWVARTWYRIVNSEDIRHLQAGTRTEYLSKGRAGTISYASKYAAKQEQKEVPPGFENVGRFWGVHGRRAVLSASTFVADNEAGSPSVTRVVKKLFKEVELALLSGDAEIVVRDKGVVVISINQIRTLKRIRLEIYHLAWQVQRWDNMFDDAELELGVGNHDTRSNQ
jgi:hypothetical protein